MHFIARAYQYNYRSEVMPPRNPPPIDKTSKFHISTQQPQEVEKIKTMAIEASRLKSGQFNGTSEWIIHPDLIGATDWNCCTDLLPCDKNRAYDNLMKASTMHTKKQNKKIALKKDYVSPRERSAQVAEEVRKLKASNSFSKDRPVFQSAEKPINRKTLVNQFAIEPARKFKTTQHSGVWEFNAAEGRCMWSDTGSFEYDSRGDVEILHNPDRYNFSNPTMVGTDQDY